ncbi:MAG TPA: hypothetical protein VFU21_06040, partial [Kofleriaceae bacterium]|nr:hypothetical protein [Kofleriaceae bacterium]
MARRLACWLALLAACGDDEIIPPDRPVVDAAAPAVDAAPPPETLRAEGRAAAGPAAAERVECSLWLDIVGVAATADGWTGAGSGEVIRRSLDGEELLFEFSALLAGEVSLTDTGGAVEARLVGEQPDDAAPFWLSLEVVTGEPAGAAGSWQGTWTCAPILPDDPGAGD